MGAKKKPFYRIVVADKRSPRDGRFIETIGTYDPLTEPESVTLEYERAAHWLSVGAQPSDAVARLLRSANLLSEEGKPLPFDPAVMMTESESQAASEPVAEVEENEPISALEESQPAEEMTSAEGAETDVAEEPQHESSDGATDDGESSASIPGDDEHSPNG